MKVKFSTNYIFAKHSGEKTKYMPSSAKIDKTATNLPYFQGVISTCAFLESQSVLFRGCRLVITYITNTSNGKRIAKK